MLAEEEETACALRHHFFKAIGLAGGRVDVSEEMLLDTEQEPELQDILRVATSFIAEGAGRSYFKEATAKLAS